MNLTNKEYNLINLITNRAKIDWFEIRTYDNGFDYVALGHVHTYSGILKYDSMYYAYSGTPEPRRYGETGEKGIICGTLDKNENNLTYCRETKCS